MGTYHLLPTKRGAEEEEDPESGLLPESRTSRRRKRQQDAGRRDTTLSAKRPTNELRGINHYLALIFILLCICLVLYLSQSSHHQEAPPPLTTREKTLREEALLQRDVQVQPNVHCSDVKANRHLSSFWAVSMPTSYALQIAPAALDANVQRACGVYLNSAVFTVHLVNEKNATSALDQRPMLTSLQDADLPGVYTFPLRNLMGRDQVKQVGNKSLAPFYHAFPAGKVTPRVFLEFGYYPSGYRGQPCGEARCNLTTAEPVRWSGAVLPASIKPLHFAQLKWARPMSIKASEEIPLCSAFGTVHGFWDPSLSVYQPYDTSGRYCRLLMPTQEWKGEPTWLRFVGDSNSREFFQNYANLLGARACLRHTAVGEKYPTTIACWHRDLRLLMTFQWFYLTDSMQATVDWLSEIQPNATFTEWLAVTPLLKTAIPTTWHTKKQTATRTYISFGSHAPEWEAPAMKVLMHQVYPLLQGVQASVRILPTTSVTVSAIPERFAAQRLVRNNALLSAWRSALMQACLLKNIAMMDLWSITFSAGVAGQRPGDAVHFKLDMYTAWAKLLFTEWQQQ